MANKLYKLYIDESGVSELTHHDKNYTLCGIIAQPYQSQALKIKADQIKFKYWNKTDIVFHSIDIGRTRGIFSLLNDVGIKRSFLKDLICFLNDGNYKIIVVSINKERARANNWDSSKIQNVAFDNMIEFFIEFLSNKGFKGQISMESSGGKDSNFHRRYISYLSHGLPRLSILGPDIRELLTSISFVSKKNQDIETQLADLFAYPATRKFLHIEELQPLIVGSYEEKITNILDIKVVEINGKRGFIRLP
jgi:hypothetical protein